MHHILNFILGLESLRPKKNDDEFTAAWKDKQGEALLSILWMVAALAIAFLLANSLDSFSSIPILGGAVDTLRPPAVYVVLAGLGFFLLRMCFAWWDLLRFARKNGAP